MPEFRFPSAAQIQALSRQERAELFALCVEGGLADEQGLLPRRVFDVVASGEVALIGVVELALMQAPRTGAEILLSRRPLTNDPWAGQWHIPGTVVRPKEVTNEAGFGPQFARILDEELQGGVRLNGDPQYFGTTPRRGVRGPELATFFYGHAEPLNPTGELPIGQFFNARDVIKNPPEGGLVEQHAETIDRALHAYNKAQQA